VTNSNYGNLQVKAVEAEMIQDKLAATPNACRRSNAQA